MFSKIYMFLKNYTKITIWYKNYNNECNKIICSKSLSVAILEADDKSSTATLIVRGESSWWVNNTVKNHCLSVGTNTKLVGKRLGGGNNPVGVVDYWMIRTVSETIHCNNWTTKQKHKNNKKKQNVSTLKSLIWNFCRETSCLHCKCVNVSRVVYILHCLKHYNNKI